MGRNRKSWTVEPDASRPSSPGNRPSSGDVSPSDMDTYLPLPDHATPTWMLQARCRTLSPADFFPSDGVGVDQARKVCAQCPVRAECLEYALTYRIDHGVWGGCSERERRRILRARKLSPTT